MRARISRTFPVRWNYNWYICIYLCTLPHTHLGINLKFINTSTMQLARVIRLSVNKSYQFIILEVYSPYIRSNLHIKSCRQCYCAQWCIQTSPEVRWNYSVRHLPNMILCTFIFTIPGFIMKNNVSSNHLSVNKSYRFIYFAPIGGTCPRHVPLHRPARVLSTTRVQTIQNHV